jgi:hypothetical protein
MLSNCENDVVGLCAKVLAGGYGLDVVAKGMELIRDDGRPHFIEQELHRRSMSCSRSHSA